MMRGRNPGVRNSLRGRIRLTHSFSFAGYHVTSREVPFDPKVFLRSAGTGRAVLQFRAGQTIFTQDEAADCVMYIQQGRLKLSVMSEQGKGAVVAILQPGQFFGESGLLEHRRRATAIALEDCTVTSITNATMMATLQREPAMCELFTRHLVARNTRVEDDLIDQLFNNSEKRLARLLLLLADAVEASRPVPIEISQETLAEMIGTTRSRVSYFMNKFRKAGFIDYNGRIEVHPTLRNAVLPDRPRALEPE
uniref:Transcriptional regulator, Crp/Fnr family n=1 Tax=Rhodopseudomonas palustris (strain ATCC BAA-98 / CGA009) TaxID=258594 RepID=Q6N332_RHOPA|nr:transcriptional regulator, Crp/Fnr family [Rhodopseudomonas palustris CGA009]